MLVKTTIKEIVETIINGNVKITDNSVCGKCSKCGECCTNLLPISQKELEQIQEYVIKNEIRPQTQMLVMQNRLTCPYHNGKKCFKTTSTVNLSGLYITARNTRKRRI